MVSLLARLPVILLVGLCSPTVSFSQQARGPGVDEPSMPADAALEGQRVTVAQGDTVVIEGNATIPIIRRRPAFVRAIADGDRGFVVLVVEYLKAAGDPPSRLTDRTVALTLPEGQWQWPLPARWEGPAWLEEDGAPMTARGEILRMETSEGTIAFADTLPDSAPGPGTRVHFRGTNTMAKSNRPPFDIEEGEGIATAIRNTARQQIPK